jgi:TDG/mug DNA glycosylase family protein
MAELIGYQDQVAWMGSPVLTLADVWPDKVRAVIVGLNPAPVSVAVGHYYQGQVGQRQMRRLVDAGPMAAPGGPHFEQVALEAGVGLTDIVKRPTSGEDGVTHDELVYGRTHLVGELARRDVPLIVCVFRHPVEALLGSPGRPGFQERTTAWGGQVFRMPSPFAPAGEVVSTMADLTAWLADDGR